MPYPAAQGGRIGYGEGSGLGSKDFVDKIYSDEARTLAGNIPEVRAQIGDYYPTLFEERENNEWKYPGEPRPGQEYLTSTLQGANTELDRMEMQKIKLKELAAEKGLNFNDIFQIELNRIIETEGPATKDITKIRDRERILNLIERKLEDDVYAQDGRTITTPDRTFQLRTPMGKKKLSSHAQGGRIGYAAGTNYGSFKDYLESNIGHLDESVQDDIWDAYGSGDEGKLFKLLKIHIDFEDRAQGGRIGAFNGGIQGLMPRPGFAFGTEVVEDTTVTEDIFSNIPPEMKMTDLDNLPEFFLIELEKLIEDYFEDIGERPRTINDIEKWYRGKNKSTMNLRENIQAPGIGDLQETVTEETLAAQGGRIGYQGNGAQDVDPMAEIVALMSKRMTEGLT